MGRRLTDRAPIPLERSPPDTFKRMLDSAFPHRAGRRVDCQAINSQPRAPWRYTARYRMRNAWTWPLASTRIAERPVTTALEQTTRTSRASGAIDAYRR